MPTDRQNARLAFLEACKRWRGPRRTIITTLAGETAADAILRHEKSGAVIANTIVVLPVDCASMAKWEMLAQTHYATINELPDPSGTKG